MFNGFKMFSYRCRSHVHEIILSKKHIWLSIETHLRFFTFLVTNQEIDMQLCTHVKNHHHHMNYLKLTIQFFSFKFISNKCYLQKVTLRKT
jgi:hypothetical protein